MYFWNFLPRQGRADTWCEIQHNGTLKRKSLHARARALSITRQNVIAIQIFTLASSFRVGVSQITPDARFPFRQVHLPFIPFVCAQDEPVLLSRINSVNCRLPARR